MDLDDILSKYGHQEPIVLAAIIGAQSRIDAAEIIASAIPDGDVFRSDHPLQAGSISDLAMALESIATAIESVSVNIDNSIKQ